MTKILNIFGLSTKKKTIKLEEEVITLKEEISILIKPAFNSNKLQAWGKKVKKSGKCDCCGHSKKEDLEAHHLWSKTSHPTLAYEKDNGVPLCRTCHRKFHEMFNDIDFISPIKYSLFKKVEQSKHAERELNQVHAEIADTKKNRAAHIERLEKEKGLI